jgi:acetyl esterase/lipase
VKRLVLLLACATLTLSACSGGSHDAGRAGGGARRRTDVERATTGIGEAGRRTVAVTPPRAREVLGDLRVPALHHRTAIVLVHGGGGFLGDRGEVHAWQDFYARSGYITLSADYFIFNDDTPPPVYPQPESDVKAAVQYVRRNADELGVDPERIVVHGFSAGARIGAQLLVGPDDPALAGPTRWPTPTDRIAGLIGFYAYYSGYQFQPDRYYGGWAGSKDPRCGKLTPVGRLSGQRVLRWLDEHFA